MSTTLLDRPRPEVEDDLGRRELLAGGTALLLAGFIGCGRERTETQSRGSSTVTVEHAGGTTEVPLAPERIVTTDGYVDLQTLLLFGVDPVLAGVDPALADGFLAGRLDGVGRIVSRGVENLELLAATTPDLIFGAEYDAERYDELAAIAPTVLLDRYGDTVDDHIRMVGKILDREDDAERFVAHWEARLAETADRVIGTPLSRSTVAMVASDVYHGQFRAFGPQSYGGRTVLDVGVEVLDPGGASDGEDFAFRSDQSVERLRVLETADLLLVQAYDQAHGDTSIEMSPLWEQLPAATAGRVIRVDGEVWYQNTPLSRLARLDDIASLADRTEEWS